MEYDDAIRKTFQGIVCFYTTFNTNDVNSIEFAVVRTIIEFNVAAVHKQFLMY